MIIINGCDYHISIVSSSRQIAPKVHSKFQFPIEFFLIRFPPFQFGKDGLRGKRDMLGYKGFESNDMKNQFWKIDFSRIRRCKCYNGTSSWWYARWKRWGVIIVTFLPRLKLVRMWSPSQPRFLIVRPPSRCRNSISSSCSLLLCAFLFCHFLFCFFPFLMSLVRWVRDDRGRRRRRVPLADEPVVHFYFVSPTPRPRSMDARFSFRWCSKDYDRVGDVTRLRDSRLCSTD